MKLMSPSWIDGTALLRVLDNPLARPTLLRVTVVALPPVLLRVATWAALVLETGFAPLALLRRARPWLWTLMLLMHIALTVLIDFADLSVAMIVFHLFTFDPAWLASSRVWVRLQSWRKRVVLAVAYSTWARGLVAPRSQSHRENRRMIVAQRRCSDEVQTRHHPAS